MNRLSAEKSLYLRQHAHNPVDWYPWGQEALQRARAEDKPLLISIGYSSCHWCHVMAHESFEDSYIAGLMNRHFVCVKVDREERPDLDHIYMEAVQMMNGNGGWPLNVFCLPDGRPFAGGTYFPPDDRHDGRIIPWPQLLMRVADYYRRHRTDLEANADAICGNLAAANRPLQPESSSATAFDNALLPAAAEGILENHDDEHGGFGQAPKFPAAMSLAFLLALRDTRAVAANRPALAARIDAAVNRSLTAMAHGGIFDQIGGGFARYSVDRYWLIPHFEKMLYDNALLIETYTNAFRRYPKPLYRAIVEETVAWLEREMRVGDQAWASALDADSEGGEGRYYVWTPGEVTGVLGSRAEDFCRAYAITSEGNFEHGRSNPALLAPDFDERLALAADRAALLEARSLRQPPARDDKQLVAWNALAARALATAAFTFGRSDWMRRAIAVADWLWQSCAHDDADGYARLHALVNGGSPQFNGYLDDYAFLAHACLSLAATAEWTESGASARFIDRARRLADTVLARFADPDQPGFFFTSDDHEQLVHRKKEWFDNAIPSGNSSMIHVLAGLHAVTGDARYARALAHMRPAWAGIAERAPAACAHALEGWTHHASGLAVIHFAPDADLDALRAALVARPPRPVFLLPAAPNEATTFAGFQLCVGTQCLPPTDDPHALAECL